MTIKQGFFGLAALALAAPAIAAPTDLSTWTAEGPGNWVLSADDNTVTQTLNDNPTVFYSDFNVLGRRVTGTARVNTSGDDDFFGFVLGFRPGDLTAAATDFLLIDWKQLNQGAFGCNADVGLALSRATAGLANNAGAWCHEGFGVTELARGATLASIGWVDFTTYTFSIELTATRLQVLVNDVLQFDQAGSFADGRFGFYNYSQAQVIYAGIEDEILPPPPPPPPVGTPAPAGLALLLPGLALLGMARRARR